MSIILPPAADVQDAAEGIDLHDFDPGCDYSYHRGDTPAALAAFFAPRPCGCPYRDYMLFCRPCWSQRTSMTVRCPHCGLRSHPLARVIRIVQLGGDA